MTDYATPNLPSADFDRTEAFYGALGFTRRYRHTGWMILHHPGGMVLEFFDGAIDPKETWFSACLRVDDLDGWYARCKTLGLSEDPRSIPRLGAPKVEPSGIRIFYMVDHDGTLIRVIDNQHKA